MAKGIYVGVSTLPSTYTQVEYVQFSGSQYFDIASYPGCYLVNGAFSPTKLEIDFIREGTAAQYLYGSSNSGNTASFTAYFGADGEAGNWRFGATLASLEITVGTRYTAIMSESGVNLNGTDFKYSGTVSTWSTSYSLYIGAGNTSGSASTSRFVGKIYSIKLWSKNNGALIRNLIPCKNANGVVGFYDLINGIWFTNLGSGSFIAGPTTTNPIGVARKVEKVYLGVNGVARKIARGYVGVNGVARAIFPGGVTWQKWTAECVSGYEEIGEYFDWSAHGLTPYSRTFYDSYEFSEEDGVTMIGGNQYSLPDELDSIVGLYLEDTTYGGTDAVCQITGVDYYSDNDFYYYYEIVLAYEPTEIYIEDTYIGEIEAEEGELPEDGELIEGSADDNYCVLYFPGEGYFYYYKQ